MNQKWIAPVVFAVLVLLGAAVYLARPAVSPSAGTAAPGARNPSLAQVPEAQPTSSTSCVPRMGGKEPRSSLNDRYRWAHSLMDQKLFDAAIPELRDIAAADPGFPGINLDLSNSLLQMHHPQEARDAVDAQIAISECLAKLPPDALAVYCRSEFSHSGTDGCRPELAHIGQAAQLQAALVHLELGHSMDNAAPTVAASAETDAPAAAPPAPAEPPPARLARFTASRHIPAPRTDDEENLADPAADRPVTPAADRRASRPHTPAADKSLMEGDGTDSALGAYSKPQ